MSRERKIEVLKSLGVSLESLNELSDAQLDEMIMGNLDKIDVLTDEIKSLLESIDTNLEDISTDQIEAYADSMMQEDFPKLQKQISELQAKDMSTTPNFL